MLTRCILGKKGVLGARPAGFKSYLCHVLSVWPQVRNGISLCLRLLIWEMGAVAVLVSWGRCAKETSEDILSVAKGVWQIIRTPAVLALGA